jgi:hypothetical protein
MRRELQFDYVPLPRTISVLIAGPTKERLMKDPSGGTTALIALDSVMDRFANLEELDPTVKQIFDNPLYERGALQVRFLTGDADGVETHVIEVAQRLNIQLDIVTAGGVRSAAAGNGTRWAAFGCSDEILARDARPQGLRNELALTYADVLIAIWDGSHSDGSSDSISRLIQRGVRADMPVIWIAPDGAMCSVDTSKLRRQTLHSLQHGEHDPDLLPGLFTPLASPADILTPALRRRLNPFDDSLTVSDAEIAMLERYATGRGNSGLVRRAGAVHEFFSGLFRLEYIDVVRAFQKLIFGGSAARHRRPNRSEQRDLPDPVESNKQFAWNDAQADIAGGRHRSNVWLLYMLSALAVFAALAGALHKMFEDSVPEIAWPVVELVSIATILALVGTAKRKNWHRRWIGHRFMAEQNRLRSMMEPLLATPKPFLEPLFESTPRSNKLHRLRSAELWLLQRSLIADGLPSKPDGYCLTEVSVSHLCSHVLSTVRDQIRFHHRTHDRMHALHSNMHCVTSVLFGLTFLAVALHFALPAIGRHEVDWLLIATGGFPALAASLYGVATKLEVERISARSEELVAVLEISEEAIRAMSNHSEERLWRARDRLRTEALLVANAMSQENEQWRRLILDQSAGLPN